MQAYYLPCLARPLTLPSTVTCLACSAAARHAAAVKGTHTHTRRGVVTSKVYVSMSGRGAST